MFTLPEINETVSTVVNHSKVGEVDLTFDLTELTAEHVEYIMADWCKTLRANRKISDAHDAKARGWKTDGKTPRNMTDAEIEAHEFWLLPAVKVNVKEAFFTSQRAVKDPEKVKTDIKTKLGKLPLRQRYDALVAMCEDNGIPAPTFEDWSAKQHD